MSSKKITPTDEVCTNTSTVVDEVLCGGRAYGRGLYGVGTYGRDAS